MNINLTLIIAASLGVILIICVFIYLIDRLRKKKDYPQTVKQRWLAIQRLCSKKESWNEAVIEADKLLGEALKSRGFKGKSIGERLVAAQRKLSDNDGVWYAHNLAKSLITSNRKRLRESDIKKALIGFRQALRDIGALHGK